LCTYHNKRKKGEQGGADLFHEVGLRIIKIVMQDEATRYKKRMKPANGCCSLTNGGYRNPISNTKNNPSILTA
jgi:hypothetical protein